MEAKQEAKLRMYRAVQNYCAANNQIISTNVAFMSAFTDLGARIDAINAAAQASEQILTGITADKNAAKQKLCKMAAETAGLIFAYAATVGDLTLKNQMDLSYSDLMKSREDMLAPRCQNIFDAGTANLDALADYGVTQNGLRQLQTAINDYSAQTPKPRTAYSQRKSTNSSLVELFEQTDQILKDRMDRLVLTFKTAHPEFVKTYEVTRRVVNLPTTHTQLKGTITDKTTAAPVASATVTAAMTENGSTPLTTTTDTAGEYHFKPIPHGACTLTVTAAGYTNAQTETTLIMGEINDLDVELVK